VKIDTIPQYFDLSRDTLHLEAKPFPLRMIAKISAFCPITSEDLGPLTQQIGTAL